MASRTRIQERMREDRCRRRRRKRRARKPFLSVSMTPMIDVVFLLLVYFVLVAEFQRNEESLALELPAQQTASAAPDPYRLPRRPVRITIRSASDAPGAFEVRADAASMEDIRTLPMLERRLRSLRGSLFDESQPFIIQPAAGARWEHTVQTLNAIEAAGFDQIRFAGAGDA